MKKFKANAVLSAYTGILVGSFSDMHEYAEHVLGRPVQTMELGVLSLVEELKQRVKDRGDLHKAINAIATADIETGEKGEPAGSRMVEAVGKIGSDRKDTE